MTTEAQDLESVTQERICTAHQRAMKAVEGFDLTPAEISAIANVTSGLSALARHRTSVPVPIRADWLECLSLIASLPASEKPLRVYEDGMPG